MELSTKNNIGGQLFNQLEDFLQYLNFYGIFDERFLSSCAHSFAVVYSSNTSLYPTCMLKIRSGIIP